MTNYNQDINILTVSDSGISILQSSDKAFCMCGFSSWEFALPKF